MIRRRVVVVGDTLLDRDIEGTVERLCPDAPVPVVDRTDEQARPGGAGLAAALVAGDGHPVTLVTALGDDPAGAELRALLERHGVEVVDLGLAAPTPEKVRVLADGRSLIRIDRGRRNPSAVGTATRAAKEAILGADGLLVSDYGRGVAAEPEVRRALARSASTRPVVWDPHPAGPPPIEGVTLTTPNVAEAERFAPSVAGSDVDAMVERGRQLIGRWRCELACITLGREGALLVAGTGHPTLVPAATVHGGDACGAGDRFASRVLGALVEGRSATAAIQAAVAAATRFVDAGGATSMHARRSTPAPAVAGPVTGPPLGGGAVDLVTAARAAGRRVVATGGCFDLLHAGHVRMLRSARALGDLLIVCVNSDRSVTALKGLHRPIVPEAARAAVLEALESVDGVLVFDEATPEAAIERIRPDLWVKGGDYSEDELPEAQTVRRLGGEIVVLPYLEGHSTTRLIEEAAQRHAA